MRLEGGAKGQTIKLSLSVIKDILDINIKKNTLDINITFLSIN